MNSEQKRAIKSTILECRSILEKDIEQVLINLGIYIDKEWVDINNLTNLNEEQRKVRENVEQVIEKLGKGGFEKSNAVYEYIKEVAYTYLNRISALRVLEVRGLIDEILISRPENGDKSFINSRFYEVAREYCKYNMDAGLSYILNLMFEEIGEEIKLLFSTEDEYSFISPSSNGLLSIIKLLCTNIDEESWKQDEIIGWIYQYFNEKEKDDVFDRLYNKKQKIKVEDIPAATQLFTPDWIVSWIVDNSLGQLWEEFKNGKRKGKMVEEIKLLDPCCGSGHFLVKAYDLFYLMYLEENKYSLDEIPFKILENNIHGIDIDLRAVQLTALILFIKVKANLKQNKCNINTKSKLTVNIVCADAVLLNGKKLKELEEKHKNNETILRMIKIIYDEFKDVRLKGSLIQPEKKLFPLFEEFKHRIAKKEFKKSNNKKKKKSEGQLELLEKKVLTLSEYISKRDFTKEEKELMDSLNLIYKEAIKANDISRQLFATEAVKSIKLVDIFMQKNGYDIVVTNPPYLFKKNMNENLKNYVVENYNDWSTDLYSVFIARALEFLNENGRLGMITQQSFMFISSYSKVRENIINNYFIEKLAHLGPKAFDDISGEKVNTVMFVIKKSQYNNEKSYFIRLCEQKNSQKKKELLFNDKKRKEYEFYVSQKKFELIQGKPFVYWLDQFIYNIFNDYDEIAKIHEVKSGMRIGANDKFLRYNWEIKKEQIGTNWKVYNKGGVFSRFCGQFPYVIDWRKNALDYYGENKSHRNKELYFKEGITYTLLSSNGFSVRLIPQNTVFDANGPSIFCENNKKYYLCGYLMSSMVSYLLSILNSTLAFTPTDVNKLPYLEPNENIKKQVENLAKIGYLLSEFKYSNIETSFNFNQLLIEEIGKKVELVSIEAMIEKKISIMKLIDLIENKIIIEIDKNIFDLYNVNKELSQKISSIVNKDIYRNIEVYDKASIEYNITNFESKEFILQNLLNILNNSKVKQALNILNKESDTAFLNEIKDVISYTVGVIFGSYINSDIIIENDGILPVNNSIFEIEIIEKIYEAFEIIFSNIDIENVISSIDTILGKSIENYIISDFFKDHIKKYLKRPIYWHICSPKKTFNCFVYYHKLDEDSLYKIRGIYLDKMIERYREDLKYYNDQLLNARVSNDKIKEKDLKNKCSDLEEKLEDLYNLDKSIMNILPYKPELDEGVLYNIIPVESILASRVSTDKEREQYYKEVKNK